MGLFNKQRTDGETYDGQGDERQGFIDLVKFNGEADDLVWRYPYDNLSIGTQLIVNESQEAIFFKGGKACDLFGPGTHTISTNNIPVLQKLINIPFGGRSPFNAMVMYINKTVRRNLGWGFGDLLVDDKVYETNITVKANGVYGIQIEDAAMFITQIVGTQHLTTTEEVIDQFFAFVIRKTKNAISRYIIKEHISILDINAFVDDLSAYIKSAIQEEFAQYGIRIVNFDIETITYDEEDENIKLIFQTRAEKKSTILEAEGLAAKRRIEGFTYQQERQLDVMETAAGNEGGAGQMMGAGMGLGMGFGIGGAFGNQMGQMAGVMSQGPAQQPPQGGASTPPPPPPGAAAYHVLIGGSQQGPCDMSALARMAGSGQLTPESYVWKAGMAQWDKAGACPELIPLFQPQETPPPPPVL